MIVNDTYGMEFDSRLQVGVGAVRSIVRQAQHSFRPTRIDLGHHHGQKRFELVRVEILGKTFTDPDRIADLGLVQEGTAIIVTVKNIGQQPRRAQPMLIGTIA